MYKFEGDIYECTTSRVVLNDRGNADYYIYCGYRVWTNKQTVYVKGSTCYGSVVGKTSDAYPDNGYQNGYWYVKVD